MSKTIALLLRIGVVARRRDGSIRWPFYIAPRHVWRHPVASIRTCGGVCGFYVFRNLPHIIKWREGRWLPIRWGVGFGGLIEFGDRG